MPYVLRYASHVPLKERSHEITIGTFPTYADAALELDTLDDETQERLNIERR